MSSRFRGNVREEHLRVVLLVPSNIDATDLHQTDLWLASRTVRADCLNVSGQEVLVDDGASRSERPQLEVNAALTRERFEWDERLPVPPRSRRALASKAGLSHSAVDYRRRRRGT
jgi:hypothetical protein